MASDKYIEVRLSNLLARVELETGDRPTQQEIAAAIDVAESTLSRFAQGKTGRYDERILIALVDYFNDLLKESGGCTLADLLAYPPQRGQEIESARDPKPELALAA